MPQMILEPPAMLESHQRKTRKRSGRGFQRIKAWIYISSHVRDTPCSHLAVIDTKATAPSLQSQSLNITTCHRHLRPAEIRLSAAVPAGVPAGFVAVYCDSIDCVHLRRHVVNCCFPASACCLLSWAVSHQHHSRTQTCHCSHHVEDCTVARLGAVSAAVELLLLQED